MMFGAVTSAIVLAAGITSAVSPTIVAKTFREVSPNGYCSIRITYPQLTGMQDVGVERKINITLKQQFLSRSHPFDFDDRWKTAEFGLPLVDDCEHVMDTSTRKILS